MTPLNIKAFENHHISILSEHKNNKKVYYFRASDIGKVVRKAYDLDGTQQTLFLTSQEFIGSKKWIV